ncbi:[histone H4]-N-methyl-L-lysine20 N-methyltransferase, partial [Tremellales sp. Uapishka_1]
MPPKNAVDAVHLREALPHPAEDLSADDDLLSWILVDQLGSLPNTKLGVHPQQVKFRYSYALDFLPTKSRRLIRGSVRTRPSLEETYRRRCNGCKTHLASKVADSQRERFISHLRRYLLPLLPSSRLEIHLTSRYSAVTGHTELAVFATSPIASKEVLVELQGSVVPLPDQWRLEMEIGEGFAVEPARGDDSDTDEENEDEDEIVEEDVDEGTPTTRRDKGKGKEGSVLNKSARRSDRTKRRDFSIVWSGLKRCFQLFLGPARFLNHDCKPNVELLRQGKYVTFRTVKPVKIGDELTTFYRTRKYRMGSKGGFTPKPELESSTSRSISAGPSTRTASPSIRDTRPPISSSLRHPVALDGHESDAESSKPVSRMSVSQTPQKTENGNRFDSPAGESAVSELDVDSPPRRERIMREATKNIKPWSFLRRPFAKKKVVEEELSESVHVPEDFPRCATCAKPLLEQVWYLGRYFDHCQRCVRHSLIFNLPWPAHKATDVREYPPPHLVPGGFIPRKISSVPLPTLSKNFRKKTENEIEEPLEMPDTKVERRARRFRRELEEEEFLHDQLRTAALEKQYAKETAAAKAEESKAERLRLREEEKRRRNENRIKGSGVWQRYEYVSEAEFLRKQAEKHQVTSGTRRGGSFRSRDEDVEMKRLAEEALMKEKARLKGEAKRAREAQEQEEEEGPEEPDVEEAVASRLGDGDNPIVVLSSPESIIFAGVGTSNTRRSRPPATISSNAIASGSEARPQPEREGRRKLTLTISAPTSPVTAKSAGTAPPTTPTDSAASQTGSEKRGRGRPKGTGHLQKAAAAAAARRKARESLDMAPASVITGGIEITPSREGSRRGSHNPELDLEAERIFLACAHHSGGSIDASSLSGLPDLDATSGSTSTLPSVDAASPEVSAQQSPSNVSSMESEMESETLLGERADEERKRKRISDASEASSSSQVKKPRTFFATKYPSPVVVTEKAKVTGGRKPDHVFR